MKKIGILTFHRAHNYGAVLQSYASLKVLRALGYQPEIIDYMPLSKLGWYNPNPIYNGKVLEYVKSIIRKSIKKIFFPSSHKDNIARYELFNRFIDSRLSLYAGESLTQFPTDLSRFDVIYIGSDQVLSRVHTLEGYDYFWGNLSGIKREDATVITYAASMELSAFDDSQIENYRKDLRNFDSISVREPQLKTKFQPLTDKPIEVVLDPTLLIDKNSFSEIMSEPIIDEPYLLIYRLSMDENIYALAERIAKEYKLKIVEIANRLSLKAKHTIITAVGPAEFVRLFNDASFVVTNSFHGTTLSLIFEKPFYALNSKGKTRIESLLKQLGIADVCFMDNATFNNLEQCKFDYTRVNEKLDNLKQASLDYIKQACERDNPNTEKINYK